MGGTNSFIQDILCSDSAGLEAWTTGYNVEHVIYGVFLKTARINNGTEDCGGSRSCGQADVLPECV
jgi:hypothetical protein